jgi:hypothetical protein
MEGTERRTPPDRRTAGDLDFNINDHYHILAIPFSI